MSTGLVERTAPFDRSIQTLYTTTTQTRFQCGRLAHLDGLDSVLHLEEAPLRREGVDATVVLAPARPVRRGGGKSGVGSGGVGGWMDKVEDQAMASPPPSHDRPTHSMRPDKPFTSTPNLSTKRTGSGTWLTDDGPLANSGLACLLEMWDGRRG